MSFLHKRSPTRTPREWPGLVAFAITCAPILALSSAAQPIPPIGVYFEDTSSTWPKADRPQIKAAVRPNIVAYVQKAFPFWQFAVVEETDVPLALHFLITEPQEGLTSVAVELWKRDRQVGATLDQPLVQLAGSLLGPPPTSDKVFAGFAALLKKRENEIADLLKKTVPIAAGGQWIPLSGPTDTLRVVLPLPWEKYQQLRESVLQLACATPTEESAILEATGGARADYKITPDAQPYPAFAIVPRRRVFPNEGEIDPHLYPELLKLSPRLVYLIQYTEPRLWDIAAPWGGGQ